MKRNFLDIDTIHPDDLRAILQKAQHLKQQPETGEAALKGKHLAMIFEKPSTRTRVSFEVGINQLGGKAVLLDSHTSQIGRGEPISDTAQVLSRYVDIMMIRCFDHQSLTELAQYASVPVINGLTNYSHPCQIMADILTIIEHQGNIKQQTVAWVGDGNNMVHSWVHASMQLGFPLRVATPKTFAPDAAIMDKAADYAHISFSHDPQEAVKEADVVTTDCWVSMGDKDADYRHEQLAPFQVNQSLMQLAKSDAIFMHCLPAHRGEEVTSEVMDGKQSVIYDEAENRLHAQKAVMLWCMQQI